jgi:hypothetical protein
MNLGSRRSRRRWFSEWIAQPIIPGGQPFGFDRANDSKRCEQGGVRQAIHCAKGGERAGRLAIGD